jgi:hypothetical protein
VTVTVGSSVNYRAIAHSSPGLVSASSMGGVSGWGSATRLLILVMMRQVITVMLVTLTPATFDAAELLI